MSTFAFHSLKIRPQMKSLFLFHSSLRTRCKTLISEKMWWGTSQPRTANVQYAIIILYKESEFYMCREECCARTSTIFPFTLSFLSYILLISCDFVCFKLQTLKKNYASRNMIALESRKSLAGKSKLTIKIEGGIRWKCIEKQCQSKEPKMWQIF